ncbi:uncharacterized protein [Fopius arisanus]|uniref:ABCB8_2 protein n=1 Tax=Fopius arisanus TaxID=64838 RepID=A0A0C9QY94_9HYME|nr:PREDICTED: uncharacterized protein LOC105266955 isoform X2 [Fopius arisanus]XP_011303793.1 PREDICTED: uncharacterized protein LOC105266955 isoform X2 [Fopius arisanus]XP_011303803.1 PREDICTED: uncharacterized protein LOC105266955 isoform X2 [Fopius arisanus]XP_011303812.1 PREDICTED: uncharacterized protein LOC105266955 isoform X2 [Fopius arisanus]
MDDTISPFDYRNFTDENNIQETECSGRSLATMLVAWVSAAMVASVLLHWKYMWIALAVLTLLFLIACGYAAFTTRRNIQRDIQSNEAYMDQRSREINSVSGDLAPCDDRSEPPAYQNYWITDLPPPYAVVIGVEQAPPSSLERAQSPPPRLSNPPPYSVAVQQDNATSPSVQSQSPISHVNSRDATAAITINDDKDTTEQSRCGHSHVLPGAQYFSYFLSTRFGLARSRNLEINSTQSCQEDGRNQGNQELSGGSSRLDNT